MRNFFISSNASSAARQALASGSACRKALAGKLGVEPTAVRNDLELLMRWEFYRNMPLDVPPEERALPDPGAGHSTIGDPKIGAKASLGHVQTILKQAEDLIDGTNGTQAQAQNLTIVKQRRDWLTKPRTGFWGGIVARGTIPVLKGKLNEHLAAITRQGKDGVLLEHLGPGDGFDKLVKLAGEAQTRLSRATAEYQNALEKYRKEFPAVESLITASQAQLPKTIKMEEAIVAKVPPNGADKWAVIVVHFFSEQSGGLLGVKPGDPVWFEVQDIYAIHTGTNEGISKNVADWQKQFAGNWKYGPHPVSRVGSISRVQFRTLANVSGLTEAKRDAFLADVRKEMEGNFGKGIVQTNNYNGPLHYKSYVRPLPPAPER